MKLIDWKFLEKQRRKNPTPIPPGVKADFEILGMPVYIDPDLEPDIVEIWSGNIRYIIPASELFGEEANKEETQ